MTRAVDTYPLLPERAGSARVAKKVFGGLILAIPGGLTAYLAFRSGGFFGQDVAVAAVVLLVAAVLRITLATEPFAGWTTSAAVVAGAGAAFAAWVLVSAAWGSGTMRQLLEFDRALVYVLAFVLLASVRRRPGALDTLLWWVLAAIVIAALAGVATRVLPDVFEGVPGRERDRLSHPLRYWNAMSVLCALGMVLAVHAASAARQPGAVRVLACAALPVLAVAWYLPLSRGGIATAALGLGAYALLARPPRLIATMLCAGPPVVVAVVAAYGAEALTTASFNEGPGPEQGHRVAVVLAACVVVAGVARLGMLRVEGRLDRLAGAARRRRARVAVVVVAVAVAAVAAAVALDAPGWASDQYRGFVEGDVEFGLDSRQRLTSPGNNGRIGMWEVSVDGFAAEPLHGRGAGTWETLWAQERAGTLRTLDGHSLYLETAAELGAVGLVLLLVMLGGLLVGVARGLRGPGRHARAAVLAGGVALLVHAGIDWDWEMPVLFLWLFAAGGLACAARGDGGPRGEGPAGERGPRRMTRVLAGVACLLLALTPLVVYRSEAALARAGEAFQRNDCPEAIDAALTSAGTLGVRAEPLEVIGYCDLRLGAPALAVRAMEAAARRDPESWRYPYGLAIARALAGKDPRPAIADARRLNPREEKVRDLARAFATDRPARWRRAAAAAKLP